MNNQNPNYYNQNNNYPNNNYPNNNQNRYYPPQPPKKSNTGLIIGIVVGVSVVVLLIVILLIVLLAGKSDSKTQITPSATEAYTQSETETETQAVTEAQTEAPTVAPTAPPVAVDHRINVKTDGVVSDRYLTDAELREVNVFISNFVEAEFGPYDMYSNSSDSNNKNFVAIHDYLNGNSSCKVSGNTFTENADTVQRNISRFFGYQTSIYSTDILTYNSSSKTYTGSVSDLKSRIKHSDCSYGKIYTFAVIDDISELFDGRFQVNFKIYKVNSPVQNSYYAYYPYQAQAIPGVQIIGSGVAIFTSQNPRALNDSMKMVLNEYKPTYY